jgi:hypothetical protein
MLQFGVLAWMLLGKFVPLAFQENSQRFAEFSQSRAEIGLLLFLVSRLFAWRAFPFLVLITSSLF